MSASETLRALVGAGIRCPRGSAEKIWERVVKDGERLPGDWDDTLQGALDAARKGDPGVCAYLAARCFSRSDDGAAALSALDARAQDALWHVAVDPVVMELPLGQERLWVELDSSSKGEWIPTNLVTVDEGVQLPGEGVAVRVRGRGSGRLPKGLQGSAECFNAGALVDLSQAHWSRRKMKRLVLKKTERLELRRLLSTEGMNIEDLREELANHVASTAERLSPEGEGAPPFEELKEALAETSARVTGLSSFLSWLGSSQSEENEEAMSSEDLRQAVDQFVEGGGFIPRCLKPDCQGRYSNIPGGQFHVLAYPLAGDFTKVLLRPSERSWTDSQRQAIAKLLQGLGESLVSQCARAGLWELVAVLLNAGVGLPSLETEFAGVCGRHAAVQRRWLKDLAASAAAGSDDAQDERLAVHRRSLLELAGSSAEAPELATLLLALSNTGKPLDLEGSVDGKHGLWSCIADAGRWRVLRSLLDDSSMQDLISMQSLATSPVLVARGPPDLLELVQVRAQEERIRGQRARTLQEFCARRLLGEAMSPELLPKDWCVANASGSELVRTEDHAAEANGGQDESHPVQVLSYGAWLSGVPAGSDYRLAFVEVSEQEAETVSTAASALPFDICWTEEERERKRRRATCTEPQSHLPGESKSSRWLPVLCPSSCVKGATSTFSHAGGKPAAWIQVPRNCIPVPTLPRCTVVVRAVTPCCRSPVPGVLIHATGKRAGITGSDGKLRLALPPGKHQLSAPDQSRSEPVSVDVDLGWSGSDAEAVEVEMHLSGDVYVFNQDMSPSDDCCGSAGARYEDWLMICTNPHQLPAGAKKYVGRLRLHDVQVDAADAAEAAPDEAGATIRPLLSVEAGLPCGTAFQRLKATPTLAAGQQYIQSEDAGPWLQELQHECVVAALFTGAPLRLGTVQSCGHQLPGGQKAAPCSPDSPKSTGTGLLTGRSGASSSYWRDSCTSRRSTNRDSPRLSDSSSKMTSDRVPVPPLRQQPDRFRALQRTRQEDCMRRRSDAYLTAPVNYWPTGEPITRADMLPFGSPGVAASGAKRPGPRSQSAGGLRRSRSGSLAGQRQMSSTAPGPGCRAFADDHHGGCAWRRRSVSTLRF
eukprot:TRINITY_DN49220_c0_g1_i1.p1 TRINITY_DN49220_c0_g1~~TRINITY_DN49220_c0_g1_i1.p1  ORF type:complete len:1104 (+),score=184.47 TRINITY_DN49220_c0_g1_i1:105-3416(+)